MPRSPAPYFIPATFNNRSDMFDLGTRYAWTAKLSTCGTVEYIHGVNDTSIPVPYTGGPYNVGGYSLVASNTVRVTMGVDYLWRPGVTTFARYDLYDFQDLALSRPHGPTSGATNTNTTGQTNMFLVGRARSSEHCPGKTKRTTARGNGFPAASSCAAILTAERRHAIAWGVSPRNASPAPFP